MPCHLSRLLTFCLMGLLLNGPNLAASPVVQSPSGQATPADTQTQSPTEKEQTEAEIRKLNDEVKKLFQAGKYDQGLTAAKQAVEKGEKAFGEQPLLAESLNLLAEGYWRKADISQAEAGFRRALRIREKTLGPDHPNTAESLNDLAIVVKGKGDFAGAETLYQRALAIKEKTLGPDNPEVAVTLNNLSQLYFDKGDYGKAEQLQQRALRIREKAFGPEHADVANSLHNLALVFQAKGDYTQAEPLFQRALVMREKLLGSEHPEVAVTLNNIGLFYWNKGDFQRAEPYYQRTLAIYEKTLGPNHRWVATTLNNLALVYQSTREFSKAEPLFQRSLTIREKAFGPNHRDYAVGLNNLGRFYYETGDYKRAEPLFQQALTVFEKALGPNHRLVGATNFFLALLSHAQGKLDQAETFYQQALAIREKVLGPDHSDVAQTFENLAGLYQAKGAVNQTIEYLTKGNEASERDLVRNLAAGSEQQKLLYLKRTEKNTDRTISANVQLAPQNKAAQQAALTILLRRKGRALDALTSSIEVLRGQQNPEVQKLLETYASLASQISAMTLRSSDRQKPEEMLKALHDLEEQKGQIENEISQRSKEFQTQITPITFSGVQQQIPADAVLLEYAVYQPYDAQTDRFGKPRYVAYTLNRQGLINLADLGETELIDRAVTKFRQVLKNPKADLKKEVKPASQALEKLVVAPLRNWLGKANHLLISPDGALSLIPFAALVNQKGKYLNEQYRLTYLTSGRDLLRLAVKVESRNPPFFLADPDYADGRGPVLAGQQYAPLPRLKGAESEGTTLKTLFPQADLKTRATATVQSVKAVSRPELLHIATHGYFLEDTAPAPPRADQRGLLRNIILGDEDDFRVENPLLRAWLFFAGANRGNAAPGTGTLTALEASQLDLWGTKLVVLSACQTGVGEAKNGDGVYGLRRALVLAGSEAQVISLWSVSDQETGALMADYYKRLKAGEGRSDALRNAQLSMLKKPKLQHPYFWAAFIQSGEWANLAGQRK